MKKILSIALALFLFTPKREFPQAQPGAQPGAEAATPTAAVQLQIGFDGNGLTVQGRF